MISLDGANYLLASDPEKQPALSGLIKCIYQVRCEPCE